MDKSRLHQLRTLPGWLTWVLSVPLAGHLLAVMVLPLAAQSGVWPVPPPFIQSMAEPPQFAAAIGLITTDKYLAHLGLAHDYHFDSNRTEQNAIYFEVRLRKGDETKTLRFPQADSSFWARQANFWVRHREKLLAAALGNDVSVRPRGAERIGPAGQQETVSKSSYWLSPEEIRKLARENIVDESLADIAEPAAEGKNPFVFVTVPDTQDGAVRSAADNRSMARPSSWALVLARSYLRYLCRKHGADSADLIRHSREPISPVMMYVNRKPQEGFGEMVAHFGDLREEQ